jgi:hypothetical protein
MMTSTRCATQPVEKMCKGTSITDPRRKIGIKSTILTHYFSLNKSICQGTYIHKHPTLSWRFRLAVW